MLLKVLKKLWKGFKIVFLQRRTNYIAGEAQRTHRITNELVERIRGSTKVTAIEAIDRELARLHEELESFSNAGSSYLDVLEEVSRLNKLLCEVALRQADPKPAETANEPVQ
jgi:Holliday junction resolvasome RuvABC ATP-dependent DNA helicase subunit